MLWWPLKEALLFPFTSSFFPPFFPPFFWRCRHSAGAAQARPLLGALKKGAQPRKKSVLRLRPVLSDTVTVLLYEYRSGGETEIHL